MTLWMLIAGLLLVVPPLSEAQRAQLQTATDDSPVLDEGALYPLLDNALQWEPGDEADARVPNYAAMMEDPEAYRGELFLLEGAFAGRPRRWGLGRPGAWGEALTEWVLVVERDPERVAVVYFVDPEGTLEPPRLGQRVRTVARFYKVWADRDMNNQPARYLTFVSRWPTLTDGGDGAGGLSPSVGPGQAMGVVLLLVAVMLYVFWRLWRMTRRPRGRPARARRDEPAGDVPPEDAEPGLPEDPAAALEELERRRREAGEG